MKRRKIALMLLLHRLPRPGSCDSFVREEIRQTQTAVTPGNNTSCLRGSHQIIYALIIALVTWLFLIKKKNKERKINPCNLCKSVLSQTMSYIYGPVKHGEHSN